MALEAGLVRDVDRDLFTNSGTPYIVEGKPFLPEACNQDIGLRTAFANSCIPIYQEIARKLGLARYKVVIDGIGYGNGVLDQAPADAGDLPFSKAAMETTGEIMIMEKTPDYTLRAKTGYLFSAKPVVGWFVGWVEKGGETHIFALNLDITAPEHAKARKTIAVKVLQALGEM